MDKYKDSIKRHRELLIEAVDILDEFEKGEVIIKDVNWCRLRMNVISTIQVLSQVLGDLDNRVNMKYPCGYCGNEFYTPCD